MEEQPEAQAAAARTMELGHSDAALRIGSAHYRACEPCQDYAAASDLWGARYPFAVVSDGCGSGARTDLGARAVVSAASRGLAGLAAQAGAWGAGLSGEAADELVRRISHEGSLMGLEAADVMATLGVARSYPGGCCTTIMGDGAMVARGSGRVNVTICTWAANMPFYPSYLFSKESLDFFVGLSERAAVEEGVAPLTVETRVIEEGGDWGSPASRQVRRYSAREGAGGFTLVYSDEAAVDVIAVITDGVATVKGASAWEAADQLTAAARRARVGSFARRRMNAALSRLADPAQSMPGDDLAVGMVARRPADAG